MCFLPFVELNRDNPINCDNGGSSSSNRDVAIIGFGLDGGCIATSCVGGGFRSTGRFSGSRSFGGGGGRLSRSRSYLCSSSWSKRREVGLNTSMMSLSRTVWVSSFLSSILL